MCHPYIESATVLSDFLYSVVQVTFLSFETATRRLDVILQYCIKP